MGFFKKIFQFNISRSADDAVDQAGAEPEDKRRIIQTRRIPIYRRRDTAGTA